MRSFHGHRSSASNRSRASPGSKASGCGRHFGPPTTWPPTCCSDSTPTPPGRCWPDRSRSISRHGCCPTRTTPCPRARPRARPAATVAELPPLDEPRVDSPDAISDAISRLRPGDLVVDDDGLRLAVLGVSWRKGGRARVRLVNESSREVRWRLEELDAPRTRSAGSICRSPWLPSGSTTDKMSPAGSVGPAPGTPHGPGVDERVEMIPDCAGTHPERDHAARTTCSARPGLDRPPLRRSHRRSPHPRPSRRLDRHRIRPHPCGHLSRGGSPRYRSAHGRSLRRPHGARTRVGCFLLHLRTPQPHATARSVVPFTDRHAALPPTGSAVSVDQRGRTTWRRGRDSITRPGFAPVAHSWAAGSRSACCSVATTR